MTRIEHKIRYEVRVITTDAKFGSRSRVRKRFPNNLHGLGGALHCGWMLAHSGRIVEVCDTFENAVVQQMRPVGCAAPQRLLDKLGRAGAIGGVA